MFILSWSWMNWSFSILDEYSWFLSDKRSTIFCGFFVLARAKNMKIWNSSDGSCSLFIVVVVVCYVSTFLFFSFCLVLFLFLRTANFREWKHFNQLQSKKVSLVWLAFYKFIQSTPDNSNLQGKSKKVRVIGSSSYRELEENSRK